MTSARFLLVLLPLLNSPRGVSADSVQVGVQTAGDNRSTITLHTTIGAAQETVWRLLTDYDHHAGFMPYMSKSRVVAADAESRIVEQTGSIKILFWTYSLRVKQRVWEEAPRHMHFMAVAGDFDELQGDFRLSPPTASAVLTDLSCEFTVKPKRRVPDWAVRMAAKHYLVKMVAVLAKKAEDRGR